MAIEEMDIVIQESTMAIEEMDIVIQESRNVVGMG